MSNQKTATVPSWASDNKTAFTHAKKDLKMYCREVLHMSPTHFAVRGMGSDQTFVVWNSQRCVEVSDDELGLYWNGR